MQNKIKCHQIINNIDDSLFLSTLEFITDETKYSLTWNFKDPFTYITIKNSSTQWRETGGITLDYIEQKRFDNKDSVELADTLNRLFNLA